MLAREPKQDFVDVDFVQLAHGEGDGLGERGRFGQAAASPSNDDDFCLNVIAHREVQSSLLQSQLH